jgi:protein O-GlcNAc transferase
MTAGKPDILSVAVDHHRAGRWDAAIEAYHQAIVAHPDIPELFFNLATILHGQGRLTEALPSYQRAIALRPAFAEAHNNLGNLLKEQGAPAQAMVAYRRAIALKPDFIEALNNLGGLYDSLGESDQAIAAYERAINYLPGFHPARFNLANLLWRLGRSTAAIEEMLYVTRLAPEYVEAHQRLGDFYLATRQFERASEAYEKAVQLDPNRLKLLGSLGNAYQLQGRLHQAIAVYRLLIERFPDQPIPYNDLATAYQEMLQFALAETEYARAIARDPNYAAAFYNLANCYVLQEKHHAAIAAYQRALELEPEMHRAKMMLVNQRQQMCDWEGIEELASQLIETVEEDRVAHEITPFPFIGLPIPTTPRQQLLCARAWSRNYPVAETPLHVLQPRNPGRSQRRLRIGYLSADFRVHSVAYMLPELFEAHDRGRFEVFAYALCGDDGSDIRKRLMRAVDGFRELQSASHQVAAQQIASDEIDILVDLQGYTTYSRTEILAKRPAPIQVSYIGFPGTMGCDFIDYILVDDYVVPTDKQPFFTERLVHLPGCYQVNDSRHEIVPQKMDRQQCGLPEEGVVFCSFNNTYKFTPRMFQLWMQLLQAVPGSVLWLAERHPIANGHLQQQALRWGVDANRLVFAKQLPIAQHLARQPLADLFLDSYPYNAHATASIALRMGVPLITLSGESMASRVAGSLLRALGLERGIARSYAEYFDLARQLATQPAELERFRQQLQHKLADSHLFDGQWFAANLEQAFLRMWEYHQAGQTPQPIAVAPCNRRLP